MKKIIKINIIVAVFLSLLTACKEDYTHEPGLVDGNSPAAISDVEVIPLHGGVKITYKIPKDKDVLYVKAVYTNSKGETKDVKSSLYKKEVVILGFDDVAERTVKLYAYDRSENQSAPYEVSFTPLTPPIEVIKQNMKITTDFGGARFAWENKEKAPISILLLAKSDRGEMEVVETVYTSQSEQNYSIRGFDTIPRVFAAVIRDRYDNFSDTIYATTPNKMLKPLWEEEIDKKKFQKLILANDTNWDAWEGDYTNFYDGSLDHPSIIHSSGSHPSPQIFSIDLGQVVKLSRLKIYQRSATEEHFAYTHGNPKTYTLYGAKELPKKADGSVEDSLEEGKGWIKLRDCESIKPSGSPLGTNTDEDMDHFRAGDEYTFDNAPPLRYFRIAFHKTWDGAGYMTAAEMTLWGTIVKE